MERAICQEMVSKAEEKGGSGSIGDGVNSKEVIGEEIDEKPCKGRVPYSSDHRMAKSDEGDPGGEGKKREVGN